MKKHLLALFLFICILGYAQEATIGTLKNGAKTVTFANPQPIVVIKIPETNSTIVTPTTINPADGKIEFTVTGGVIYKNGDPYTISLKNGTTEILNATNYSFEFVSPNQYKYTITGLDEGTYNASVKDATCPNATTETFTINKPLPIAIALSGDNNLTVSYDSTTKIYSGKLKCFDGTGTLTASPTEGFPYSATPLVRNYTYNWAITYPNTTTASSIMPTIIAKAGSYTLTVKDLSLPTGNDKTVTIVITENPKIEAIPALTSASCKGDNGSISLAVTGGITPYTIVWDGDNIGTAVISNSDTKLTGKSDTYTYSITDNLGCKLSTNPISEVIEEPSDPFSVTFDSSTPPSPDNLANGTINIKVNGGYGKYTYLWKKDGIDFTPSNNISLSGLGNGTYSVVIIDKKNATDINGCPKTIDNIVLKSLSATINILSPINCIGDTTTLEAMPSGGSKSYAYQWFKGTDTTPIGTNKTLPNCNAGDYKVLVKDTNNTSHTFSVLQTLINPPNPPISIVTSNHTAVNCYGGSDGTAYIEVKDGSPVNGIYTFLWDKTGSITNTNNTSTISGLSGGTYTVTVKDKYCAKNFSFTISQPINPITFPTETITKVSIFGQSTGEINFASEPTGGNGGYTYNWTSSTVVSFTPKDTKNISGLKAGSYTLEIIDSKSCSISKTFVVTQEPELLVNIIESSPIKCYGDFNGELQAIVTGGVATYNYQWFKNGIAFGNNSFEQKALEFGDYKVIVTDFVGATKTATTFTLKQPTLLSVTATAQTNVLCHNAKTGAIAITINGGTAPYTQQWTKDVINYSIDKDLINLEAGTYQVTVTDAVGHNCTATLPNSIIITQPTDPLKIDDLEVKDLTGFETKNGSIKVAITGGTSPYNYTFGNQSNVSISGSTLVLDKLPMGSYTLTITDANGCTTSNNYNLIQPDKLLITAISQTPTSTIKCYGDKFGILEATITGGVLPYTYNWHNILTPTVTASTTNPSETLVAGTYELKVTDVKGNTFSLKSNPIIEPQLLKINSTPKNVSCKNGNDGSITISTSGGTGVPTINWSTGENTTIINNLFAGTYSVTITDQNQCQAFETINITEPDILYVSKITKNPPSALGLQDGSIEIQVTGGTPNYNYLWYNGSKDLIYSDLNQPSNTSINNIYAGQYFVTVKDANGCAIIEKDLDKIDPLVLSINQINIVKCNGDATASIKASASGGTPIYYYKWYKTTDPLNAVGLAETLTNATAGTYFVVLLDSFGLTKQSENITITEPATLTNTLSSEYTRCGDAKDWTITTAPIGGTAPYTYLWNTGEKTATLLDVIPGTYSVLVTDNNGCSITKNITITAPVHLATVETITKPTCFEGSDATIVLTSSGGQGPYTYLWNTGEKSNTLSNASAKVYSVAVTDFKGCVIDKTYTIENPPKDVINLGEDVTLCFDQSLTINSTIADDKAKYAWTSTKGFKSDKPIITVSEPAEYTLVVTNRLGCTATDMLKISKQETAISAEFAVSSQVFVNEKFIIVDISNPIADGIEWSIPAEATVVSKNKDFAELSFSKVGEYELTLNTKKGNCTATQTKKIVVIEGEYVDPDSTDLKKKFDLKIYPNPSNGIFTVDVTLDKIMPAHIKVYNLNNNAIIDSKYEEGKDAYTFNFSLSGLTSGVYFVLVESQQGNQLRKIIIK
jgi:hypothetical protein